MFRPHCTLDIASAATPLFTIVPNTQCLLQFLDTAALIVTRCTQSFMKAFLLFNGTPLFAQPFSDLCVGLYSVQNLLAIVRLKEERHAVDHCRWS